MSEYIVKVYGQMPDAIYERAIEEIVRCRDCKFLVPQINDDPLCIRPYENVALWTNLDGFCAWAERRINE